jgi:carbon monoxide dehydrogenase subunit G
VSGLATLRKSVGNDLTLLRSDAKPDGPWRIVDEWLAGWCDRGTFPPSEASAMKFEGEKDFPLPPNEVWAKLSDARFLVQCVPDSTVSDEPQKERAVCTVRPGFAFVRGTLEVTLTVGEAIADRLVKLGLHSKGVGASSEVAAEMNLTAKDRGTHLHWTAEVTSVGGLLKMVPSGLIRGAAQKVIGDVLANVEAKLTTGSG